MVPFGQVLSAFNNLGAAMPRVALGGLHDSQVSKVQDNHAPAGLPPRSHQMSRLLSHHILLYICDVHK